MVLPTRLLPVWTLASDSRCLATIVGLYSHLNDGSQQLGIQTREAFESGMRVPMGFSTQLTEALFYKISIENIDGQNIAASKVYLVDNETQSVTDLTTDSYSFVVSEGTYHNRFLLILRVQPFWEQAIKVWISWWYSQTLQTMC